MRRLRTSASNPSGQFVEPKIREHKGRTLKNTGEGFLSEFSSVTDAVRCAIEIQGGMLDRERSVPKERRILFRIGLNLGDVIFEEHDICGHRVNVTFRLEALGEPQSAVADRCRPYRGRPKRCDVDDQTTA
jgi:adenylate cyclase